MKKHDPRLWPRFIAEPVEGGLTYLYEFFLVPGRSAHQDMNLLVRVSDIDKSPFEGFWVELLDEYIGDAGFTPTSYTPAQTTRRRPRAMDKAFEHAARLGPVRVYPVTSKAQLKDIQLRESPDHPLPRPDHALISEA